MTQQTLAGTGASNPQEGSHASAKGKQGPLYFFRPFTPELLVCPAESVESLAQEIALMNRVSEDLIAARQELGLAHSNWLAQQDNTALQPHLEAVLKTAAKKEEAAAAKAHEALAETPAFNKDGVWELMPLIKRGAGGERFSAQQFVYVRSSKIVPVFKRIKLDTDKPQMKSFLVKDPATGKRKIDHEKVNDALKEALHKYTLHEWKTPPWGKEWAPEFAESFNKWAQYKTTEHEGEMAEFSAGTQILRFFAGAGMSAKAENSFKTFDDALHLRGEIAVSGKAKGEVGGNLASGKLEAIFYLPSKQGMKLWIPTPTEQKGGGFTWGSVPESELGFFRLYVKCGAEASCGGSLLAEVGLEFKRGRGNVQQFKGSPAKPNVPALLQPRMDVTKFDAKADGGGDLKAFVGVEAEGSIEGAFDWRRPGAKKDDWKKFASVKPGASAQGGAGVQAAFHITYDEGKFRVLAKLGACLGLGLKGEVEAVVDVVEIAEFAWWAKTQVAYAGDKNIKYFETQAFKTFVAMYTLVLAKGKKLEDMAKYLGRTLGDLTSELTSYIASSPRQFVEAIKNANDTLLNGLAEVKGYIVYALQRIGNNLDDLRRDAADAIERVLLSAQISNELSNVYQNVSPNICERGDAQLARNAIGNLIGMGQVATIEGGKRKEPAPGYRFEFSNTHEYAMQVGTNVAWLDSAPMAGSGTMAA
ncbi:hypothetical protein [Burkholderia sp.]|uniref:hypothetical protein n=1 Tax=Burkholderia sp. TaxID=36773 RepID=UPI002590D8E3|nr:hypothetical protein [Burkholderia sp.]MCA3784841.1 hypothetical protein [Burkholderia sp.]